MSYVGRIDDTFVFTRHNDVIIFTPSSPAGERVHKVETNLDHLDVATLWGGEVLVAGDGDEYSHIDKDGNFTLMYDGELSDVTITLLGTMQYGEETVLHFETEVYGTLVTDYWGMYIGL